MRTAIGQRKSYQQCLNAEDAAELRDNRDAATFANERNVAVESFAQRTLRCFTKGRMRIGEIPRAAVTGGDVHRHAFGQILLQMRLRQVQDLVAFLFGNETKCQFRHRMTGNDSLCPLPLIPAADSVDLSSWTCPNTIHRIVTCFSKKFGLASFLTTQFAANDSTFARPFDLLIFERLD